MQFTYKARDTRGKTHEGTLDVGSREEATQRLKRDGFTGVQLFEQEEEDGGLFPRSVKKNDVIYTASQLSIMVETGITLSAALGSLASQEENPTLREVLKKLKEKVDAGQDFSAALAEHPHCFDRTFVSLVKASEETGSLGEMLDRISGYLRKELDTQSKIKGAMAYPAVMALVAVAVTIFLLTYILPQFEPLFGRKGVKLPQITVVLMWASKALLGYWYYWLAGAVGLGAGFGWGRGTAQGKRAIDFLWLNLPIVGPVVRKVTISRSIRALGTMVKSGVSVLDALKLCADISGNSYYEQAWLKVLDRVTQGDRICDSLMGNSLFPRTLVQMIGSGEDTGKLDFVLEKVSNFYDREVETAIKTATSLIEPLMITVMGVVVGGIAMGLLLPIFQLSRSG